MSPRHILLAGVLVSALAAAPLRTAPAATLELAFLLDGSSSISDSDWTLQVDAYQNILQANFYTNLVAPSIFSTVYLAAYVFTGGLEIEITDGGGTVIGTEVPIVTSYLAWSAINNDTDASTFGAQFGTLPHPKGTTATSEALDIVTSGGLAGCAVAAWCNITQTTVPGIRDNGITADQATIDISTDGVPTEPNGNGTPNDPDRVLAIASADAARGFGITVNAIGVGMLDATFLAALVGSNPVATPEGFFVTAEDFSQFQGTLLEKIAEEVTVIPGPATLPLVLTGIAALGLWHRRRTPSG